MTPAQIQVLLDEAKAAYHRLMIGGSVVEVRDQNGESVRYNVANAARLAAYIAELERQLGAGDPVAPLRVYM